MFFFFILQDVNADVKDIVDLVVRINFTRLMTIFNLIMICPVAASQRVAEEFPTRGALKAQKGFIVKNKASKTKGKRLMNEK